MKKRFFLTVARKWPYKKEFACTILTCVYGVGVFLHGWLGSNVCVCLCTSLSHKNKSENKTIRGALSQTLYHSYILLFEWVLARKICMFMCTTAVHIVQHTFTMSPFTEHPPSSSFPLYIDYVKEWIHWDTKCFTCGYRSNGLSNLSRPLYLIMFLCPEMKTYFSNERKKKTKGEKFVLSTILVFSYSVQFDLYYFLHAGLSSVWFPAFRTFSFWKHRGTPDRGPWHNRRNNNVQTERQNGKTANR